MKADKIYRDSDFDSDSLVLVRPVVGNEDFKLEGAEGYLFKCVIEVYDEDKIMAKLGISKADGWKYECDGSAEDGWEYTFTNGKDETKEIIVPYGDSNEVREFLSEELWWCILTDGDYLADMRKGANEKFYEEDMWDSDPVCSKRILAEHMEKYFDNGPGYYNNCQKAFKKIIFDQFKDGKGLCVLYS